MPGKKGSNSVLAKLGDKGRKALLNHKDDETKYAGGSRLPTGLEGVICQLTKCEFGEFKEGKHKGEPFYMASGVVVAPREHAGTQTQLLMEPLCDTPERAGEKSRKTLDEHIEWVLNNLRTLGADTGELEDLDNLEGIAESLVEVGPYFKLRTWNMPKQTIVKRGTKWVLATEGKPDKGSWPTETAAKAANPYAGQEPRTIETWLGNKGLEDYVHDTEESAAEHTSDDSAAEAKDEAEASTNGEGTPPWESDDLMELAKAADKDNEGEEAVKLQELANELEIDFDSLPNWKAVAKAILAKQAEAGSDEDPDESEEGEAAEAVDWVQLGELGDNSEDEDGENARGLLAVEAQRRELDPDDYPSWEELGTYLSENEPEAAEAEEATPPKKGDIVKYKPAGKAKASEYEVTMVLTKSEKVSLKSLDDQKVLKDIPWSKIS